MKVTYLTHACLLIEAGGKRLLTDPWLSGPCWGGNIWHYPPPRIKPEELRDIDFIYFSHAHDDHLHPESLRRMSAQLKAATVIIPSFEAPYFEKAVRANGFQNIKILDHEDQVELAPGFTAKMLINDTGDDDSSMLLKADGSSVFLQTDNLMSLKEAERVGKSESIDVVFTISALTGIFPGFFDFPSATMSRLSSEKKARGLNYSVNLVSALKAKHAVPYASDLCYMGDLYFANDLHHGDKAEFSKLMQSKAPDVTPILMGPDDTMTVENHKVNVNLGTHDYKFANLAAHAVAVRHEVDAIRFEERKYEPLPYADDIEKLRRALDGGTKNWSGKSFRTLWKIVDPQGQTHFFSQVMPEQTQDASADWKYDLLIELPSYRLQRLMRGDYKMGFITLWNGCARCHRHTETLTPEEKNYWDWSFRNVRVYQRAQ